MTRETLDYAPAPGRLRLRPWVWVTLILLALFVALSLLLPTLDRTRDHPGHLRCSSNLKQIGQAMLLYANESRGAMPPDFATLIETQDLPAGMFVCAITNDQWSVATQPAARRLEFQYGSGFCSYVYVDGYARFDTLPAEVVVAFEPIRNHGDHGNVLFGDGHVEYLKKPAIDEIQRQYDNAVRPIRVPAGLGR